MSHSVAVAILNTIRQHLELSIGEAQIGQNGAILHRLEASSATGERWVAMHEDYYRASCLLAEMVGFDLGE